MKAELYNLTTGIVPPDFTLNSITGTQILGENCIDLPKDIDKKTLKRGEMEVQQLPPFTYAVLLFCPIAMPGWA
jgi:hypothetical protein